MVFDENPCLSWSFADFFNSEDFVRCSSIVVLGSPNLWAIRSWGMPKRPRGLTCEKSQVKKEVKMKDRLKMLYLGAMAVFLAGVILAVAAAGCARPLVIGLTAGACTCFVGAAILLTIRRLRQTS